MRVRVVEVEGTPQELAQIPQLMELLSQRAPFGQQAEPGEGAQGVRRPMPPSILPPPVQEVLDARSPRGPLRETIETFLREVLQWPDVETRIGTSRMSKDGLANMIRLHRRGSGLGAFVYLGVTGANLQFRLRRDKSLEGYTHARARNVQQDAPYGIAMRLSKQSLPEAIRLSREAYDRTLVETT
jgi:hypothetical protein